MKKVHVETGLARLHPVLFKFDYNEVVFKIDINRWKIELKLLEAFLDREDELINACIEFRTIPLICSKALEVITCESFPYNPYDNKSNIGFYSYGLSIPYYDHEKFKAEPIAEGVKALEDIMDEIPLFQHLHEFCSQYSMAECFKFPGSVLKKCKSTRCSTVEEMTYDGPILQLMVKKHV